jgi:hypothetical protein
MGPRLHCTIGTTNFKGYLKNGGVGNHLHMYFGGGVLVLKTKGGPKKTTFKSIYVDYKTMVLDFKGVDPIFKSSEGGRNQPQNDTCCLF